MRTPLILTATSLLACATVQPVERADTSDSTLTPTGQSARLNVSAEAFAADCERRLIETREAIGAFKAADGKDPLEVLEAYDDIVARLGDVAVVASVGRNAHPDAAIREAGEACGRDVGTLGAELSLDRELYERLAAIDPSGQDAVTRRWHEELLLSFKRSGVDRDEETREKAQALSNRLTELGQSFGKNIIQDARSVTFSPEELEGLPADFLAKRPVNDEGKIVVTTDYPDYFPVMTYAKQSAAREKLWRAYRQRGYPANVEVLDDILETRHELATLLGYDSWADYVTEDKMIGDAAAARTFIERIEEASRARGEKEYQALLAARRKEAPSAKRVQPWDQGYLENLIVAEQLGFDAQAIRPYFEYSRVKQGVLDVTGRMFGITYEPVEDPNLWHPDVDVYDVRDGEKVLGRIYLDMHPREGKYKHAAHFTFAIGREGIQLPESVLMCNFPEAGELMEPSQVETFFHEFGHLVHGILGGHQRWAELSGVATERDFVEAPSMLLQQWAVDPDVLATFAKHHETDEPVPTELVQQLAASKELGKGLWTRRQMFLSDVSLSFHDRAPPEDPEQLMASLQGRHEPFRREWVPGTHFHLSFGHLNGYSAVYYTYIWSQVIARDLQTVFEREGMLATEPARRYREAILEPGGSAPAAELVERFLGRPYSFEAYEAWMNAPLPGQATGSARKASSEGTSAKTVGAKAAPAP